VRFGFEGQGGRWVHGRIEDDSVEIHCAHLAHAGMGTALGTGAAEWPGWAQSPGPKAGYT
jgi:hypothetical protein